MPVERTSKSPTPLRFEKASDKNVHNERPTDEQIIQANMFAMRNGYAGMAMQGFIAKGESDPKEVAKKSLVWANAMMEVLFNGQDSASG